MDGRCAGLLVVRGGACGEDGRGVQRIRGHGAEGGTWPNQEQSLGNAGLDRAWGAVVAGCGDGRVVGQRVGRRAS
jgi:hypothetical protein